MKHAARKVGAGEGDGDSDEIVIQDWGYQEMETPREHLDELKNRQRFNFESIMAQKSSTSIGSLERFKGP